MCIRETEEGLILEVRVQPRSKKEEVKREGKILRIRVKAPPEKGRANKACIELLSKKLGLRKSQIHLVRGDKSQNKVFLISGAGAEEVSSLLTD